MVPLFDSLNSWRYVPDGVAFCFHKKKKRRSVIVERKERKEKTNANGETDGKRRVLEDA